MDSKNLEERGINSANLTVKRKRGRPRKNHSHNLKAEEEMVNSSNGKVSFSGNSPEFFKIFTTDLCSTMLRIPPDFIDKFCGNVPTTCTLKRPWGVSWEVDVNKINDCWFFQKGWPQFLEQNSVKEFDFLTFCYLGKSVFLVKIFLPNGCAKGPVPARKTDYETSESENSEKINGRKPRKVSGVSPNGCAKGSGHASRTDDETSESEKSEEINNGSKPRKVSEFSPNGCAKGSGHVSKTDNGTSESENSEEINGSKMRKVSGRWGNLVGEVDGKPCFSILLYKSYIKEGRVCVPLEFWNAYMREHKSSKMATLWVEDHSWIVELVTAPDRVMFRGGKKFLRDNSLKVDDSCTFQLIDPDNLAFNVTFRRE